MSNPKFRFWLVLTVLWVAVIYFLSCMSAEISTAQSTSVWEVLRTIWPSLTHAVVRKIAHGLEYMVLGSFALGMFFYTKNFKVAKPMLFSVLIALGDETLQLHVTGRSSEVMDVWLDFGGAIVGILIFWGILTVRKNQTKNKA